MSRTRGRPRGQGGPPGYIPAPEVAELWGVTTQTIRNRINKKTLHGKVVTLDSGEIRYFVPRWAVEAYLTGNGTQRLLWEGQGAGVDKLAARLDAITARLDAIAARQEGIESTLLDITVTLQQQEQTAERERDELRKVLAQDDRTESDRTKTPRIAQKRGVSRKIDGDKVRSLRESRFWKQEELADKAGVSRPTMSEIETGGRPRARRETIFAIAEALEVEPGELVPKG